MASVAHWLRSTALEFTKCYIFFNYLSSNIIKDPKLSSASMDPTSQVRERAILLLSIVGH
jgi:hypothetical protein